MTSRYETDLTEAQKFDEADKRKKVATFAGMTKNMTAPSEQKSEVKPKSFRNGGVPTEPQRGESDYRGKTEPVAVNGFEAPETAVDSELTVEEINMVISTFPAVKNVMDSK